MSVRLSELTAAHGAPNCVTTYQLDTPEGKLTVAEAAVVVAANAAVAAPLAIHNSYPVAPATGDHENATRLSRPFAPSAGAISVATVVRHGLVTFVVTDAELLLVSGSLVDDPTFAVARYAPAVAGAVTLIVTLAAADAASELVVQVKMLPALVQLRSPVVVRTVTARSSVTETDGDCAAVGPWFAMFTR